MKVTFKKHDATAEKTIDVSPDSQLGEAREAVQMLLGLPENFPYKLILERANRELENRLTFQEAGIKNNDTLILSPITEPAIELPQVVSISSPDSPNIPTSPLPNNTNFLGSNDWRIAIMASGIIGAFIMISLVLIVPRNTTPAPVPSPTPAPVPSPTPASVPSPTPASVPSPTLTPPIPPDIKATSQTSPEQALRNYYDFINSYDYQQAWDFLSLELRQNSKLHPEGYKSYTDWWTQVAKVDVLGTKLVSANEWNSIVKIDVKYFMKSGRQINQTLDFDMVWDRELNRWLISEVKRL